MRERSGLGELRVQQSAGELQARDARIDPGPVSQREKNRVGANRHEGARQHAPAFGGFDRRRWVIERPALEQRFLDPVRLAAREKP